MSSLKKNVIYSFIYQFLILFLPLVTAPYLSRVIGPNGIGIYSYSYSIALYFSFFTLLGLNNYGNREIASIQNDFKRRSKTFWEIYTMQFLSFLVCLVLYFFYSSYFAIDKKAAIIQGIIIFSSVMDINWFFFGMEKFKITVIRNSIVKLITVICIFTFVKDSDDIYIYIAIMAFGTLISQISLWPFLKTYIQFTRISFKGILKHVKPNLILFVPVISVSIYKIMDKVMLGHLSSIAELGYFDSAEKIINVPIALITAIGTVMMPRVTSLISKNRLEDSRKYLDKTMFLVLAFATGAMIGIISISEQFSVLFYGDLFQRSGVIMDYLSITVLFLAFGNVIRTQFLIPSRKDKIFVTSAILGAFFNFTFNLFLIPRYGAVGAAIGTIIAEFVVCFYQFYFVRKYFPYIRYIKYELLFLFSGTLMYFVVQNIPRVTSDFLNLFIKIIFGILIYCIIVFLFIFKIKKPGFFKK